jgi:hypothetical protein
MTDTTLILRALDAAGYELAYEGAQCYHLRGGRYGCWVPGTRVDGCKDAEAAAVRVCELPIIFALIAAAFAELPEGACVILERFDGEYRARRRNPGYVSGWYKSSTEAMAAAIVAAKEGT